ncbi:MAG: M48 family metallopeptidase [Azoarcus sp.]|jgi:Zn-dependent protease with chaperone function|nr:M48 family metallopeptidase [Azoarcus sp.]
MDFFAAQDRARKNSRFLVFWFVLAVMCIIAVIYLCVSFGMTYKEALLQTTRRTLPVFPFWDGTLFFWVFLLVGGGIASVSLFKIWQISRRGGALIAEQLGGRMITRNTNDPAEKRLLNVIDEMAIAAGVPAPLAFVLDAETSMNAFAAGLSIQDSVIGVTRGLLDAMNRDELQGVIGHEISHIVNGDSRLYLRLVGVLSGIYAITIAGRALVQVRGKNAAPAVLSGLILCVVGFIGFFFGRLIQAAVSREREYLADAFSVQFTRHPAGLTAALEKLRNSGSRIQHPQAVTISHFFFGASGSLSVLFATHPPLANRIRRLGGLSVQLEETSQQPMDSRPLDPAANPYATAGIASFSNAAAATSAASAAKEIPFDGVTQAQNLLASLPVTLRQQAREVTGATGIIGGLFLSEQPDVRARQEEELPPAALSTAQELCQWMSSQPEKGAHYRIVWLDLVLPVLREEPQVKRHQLLVLVAALIHADGHTTPSGFALYSLLRNGLLSPSAHRFKRGELRANRLDQDIASLLALIAHAGHESPEAAKAAYQAAIACSPARTPLPLPEKTVLSLTVISQALAHLALATPPYRKKLLDACATAICHDGKITPVENELLRAFAQNLDCPVPLAEG